MTPELYKEAREARIGADRMAMGLSCIPDPLRGDMAEVERLRAENAELRQEIQKIYDRWSAMLRALEGK